MLNNGLIEDRFWSFVDKNEAGCWNWKGKIDSTNDKGRFYIGRKHYYPIHLMFLFHDGIDVPSGMMAFNLCGNDACVNPDHYEIGTKFGRKVNNQFRSIKPLEERFWRLVDVSSEDKCWEWKASLDGKGYGQFNIDGHMKRSHRIAWLLTNGEIPEGMLVCHKCDNPPCVNPNHLFLGTQKDNMQDMKSKGRRKY